MEPHNRTEEKMNFFQSVLIGCLFGLIACETSEESYNDLDMEDRDVPYPEFDLMANSGSDLGMKYTYNTTKEVLRMQEYDGAFADYVKCSYKESTLSPFEYFANHIAPSSWEMHGSVSVLALLGDDLITVNNSVYSNSPRTTYTMYTRETDGTVSSSQYNLDSEDVYVGEDEQTYYLYVVCASKCRGDIANINGNIYH